MDLSEIEKVEPRPSVMFFARLMEIKLRQNDHKGGQSNWRKDTGEALFARLEDEVAELLRAIVDSEMPVQRIWEEATDVANFAMFLADKALAHPLATD